MRAMIKLAVMCSFLFGMVLFAGCEVDAEVDPDFQDQPIEQVQ